MPIYFAQPENGGPIKIGKTVNTKERLSGYAAWLRLEPLAEVPGSTYREALLHRLCYSLNIHGEWFRSDPTIWQLVLEARSGDIPWLPEEPKKGPAFVNSIKERSLTLFGSSAAFAATVGVKYSLFANSHLGTVPQSVYATVVAEELIRAGALPEYLRGLQIGRLPRPGRLPRQADPAEVSAAPDPGWATGEGKRRRLTYEGQLELERRLAENQSDSEIAKAMGLSRYTVIIRRQRMNGSGENDQASLWNVQTAPPD